MSESTEKAIEQDNARRLSAAILDVKTAMADRDDAVLDIRDVQRTRLELLKQELQDVIEDVPDDQTFDFAITSGAQPRFWIDAVAHVSIGRDRRTYRFVRDMRAGRVVLAESSETKTVADSIARYVAERIVERQRQLEATDMPVEKSSASVPQGHLAGSRRTEVERDRMGEILSVLAYIAVGVLIGGVIIVALLRERIPELDTLF